ncbi:hypothetical protein A2954_07045 [Candidatus Roizmanbacteria bacterium RIFCSPLOWO2_01_FULL_37_12]|uniref:Uncharacterized protein n=1 Tax=Candidatus Roizmanbacteria bacterium RIFCSPLOWO2_01_FULL_37_12 TaxID=1802056 RepID=A0A1F7IE24_9BACT|nr:MAG: hypothetical protein A3D76_02350 [Candidatus Roizmanbacteria bacterium RIFCSPHIGHO2_02_FULL_37_9b]OGK41609.1 MAG: hypothetical protein A2954_07045 [Candidatus Roizmanbacteria bacterium RIFCSPLOWO2_01_FULL_37_12]
MIDKGAQEQAEQVVENYTDKMIKLGGENIKEWYKLWIITGKHPKAEENLNAAKAELESYVAFKNQQTPDF